MTQDEYKDLRQRLQSKVFALINYIKITFISLKIEKKLFLIHGTFPDLLLCNVFYFVCKISVD